MIDYIRRFLIVLAVAFAIGILFLGATAASAKSETAFELTNFIWPTVGLVTDTFGTRDGKHYGIDIAASQGSKVVSISNGIVTKSYYSNTYGNVVFIEHSNGYQTVSAHLHERNVQEGDFVYQGQKIGIVGNTGRSSGNHLHFEVHDGAWTTVKQNAFDPFLAIGKNNDTFFVLDSDKLVVNQQLKVVPRVEYIVKRGDTLSGIAEQSGSSVAKIKKINGLKGDIIQTGTVLKVHQ
ncbi:peptidoglycan DD-metalloendopeptidase family protein [Bacillaceae bacterium IKA-2]|nr:peptidoglycan DD-metalloendopeptidase family protein [Bacillaceae bacterium IKA-2]